MTEHENKQGGVCKESERLHTAHGVDLEVQVPEQLVFRPAAYQLGTAENGS